MITMSPAPTLRGAVSYMRVCVYARATLGCAPDGVVRLAAPVDERRAQRDDVVVHRDAVREGHARVEAQRLAQDGVEVRQRGERVHRRALRRHAQQLGAQARLDVLSLRQPE